MARSPPGICRAVKQPWQNIISARYTAEVHELHTCGAVEGGDDSSPVG